MPSKQETFDTVVQHLRKQGCQAVNDTGCVYFDDETGHQCAVGFLIPRDRYFAEMEGHQLCSEVADKKLGGYTPILDLMNELGHDIDLLMKLQFIHDDGAPCFWESKFAKAASDFNLTYTPPTED